MSGLDLTNLSGPDAAVALRSYPRRFREAIFEGGGTDTEHRAFQVGSTGHSAAELVSNTASSLVLLGQALHQVLVNDDPVVHAGVADASQRAWDLPPGATLDSLLEHLSDEAKQLADAVDRVHGHEWSRAGRLAGGGTTTALDIVREAVRAGADNLRAVSTTLASVR